MPHLPEPVTVTLEYTDADGIETRRHVDVYRTAKKSGYSTITGFCHGRQAERTFRSDRVDAVITEDGEILSAQEFLATLRPGRSEDVDMSPINRNKEADENSLGESLAGLYFTVAIGHGIFTWVKKDFAAAVLVWVVYILIGLSVTFLVKWLRKSLSSSRR